MAAEPLKWVKEPELAFDEKAGRWYATFELDALSPSNEPAWEAPELDLVDGTVLVLDAGEPFPPDGFDGFPDD